MILLDSGSTTSMMSLDLARQLGLKLRFDERLRVKGIGNVTTYVSAKATVKITLGASVVYYLEIWCGNIGEGIQCLLGMDFMIAAGVRLGAREVRIGSARYEEWQLLAFEGSYSAQFMRDQQREIERHNARLPPVVQRPALRDQLAVLPDLVIDDKPADVSAADVGEADESTPKEVEQVRSILRKHQSVFLGSGNAVPPPARGVVCDIEVPAGTKPISQRARRISGHLLEKVYELVQRLLEAGIVEYSDSEQVNQLITLMSYPLPLIDEMLDNFDKAMWFLSLDMASGFWAISMTRRAQHISAFPARVNPSRLTLANVLPSWSKLAINVQSWQALVTVIPSWFKLVPKINNQPALAYGILSWRKTRKQFSNLVYQPLAAWDRC
ncbi:hypothetical protein P43SY_011607 [Pythium insidiosum]|uniref:Peptidase A2 domain-containing protein n=1 Tax=Pythium insidiosum TaxID=114742 RepID=A0AAD5M007_PYTIN|nr:hypothetical protein P43SY_011607 [Pythium insidiosum]